MSTPSSQVNGSGTAENSRAFFHFDNSAEVEWERKVQRHGQRRPGTAGAVAGPSQIGGSVRPTPR